MKITKLPQPLMKALPVLRQLNQAGFEAYFVGGCVRDTLLSRALHDVDLATSAYPQEIKQVFSKTIDTGIKHGTVTVIYGDHTYEITTFRTESGYQDFRRPDVVKFVRSLQEDLQRRDFTINALAMNANGEVIDLFSGLADLKNCQIRAVGYANERFHEDALRMLRAVRFQAQLNFKIEEQTLKGIKNNASLLQHIAIERIREEFLKLMQGTNRQAGLQSLYYTHLYQYCPSLKDYNLEDLLRYNMGKIESEAAVWSLLGYIGKLDKVEFKKFLKSWKVANRPAKLAQRSVELLATYNGDNWCLYQAGSQAVQIAAEVLKIVQQIYRSQSMLQQYKSLPLKSAHQLAIDGQQIMAALKINPGPQIGADLQQVQKAIVAGNLDNTAPAIIQFLKQKY
ncbi:CCA tRNA nucleotidyltransferase [Bombilactobacillus bombi]|uniref:CCA tRNA nucleotidyltransferase n=1 Tax=Bombilactobacillus bombi TaxID=1303590 RepID=UPI0015E5ADAB|nr:CCA tRNA nucleotidyltransferase [Bombilactobacillus bombi]MBA1435102.1 CCA tRNA nucleotidyltransferase [Bombilactobacillus bombi]